MVGLLDRWIEKESLVEQYLFVDKMQGKRAGGRKATLCVDDKKKMKYSNLCMFLRIPPQKRSLSFAISFLCAIAEKSCWSQDGDGSLGGKISHP